MRQFKRRRGRFLTNVGDYLAAIRDPQAHEPMVDAVALLREFVPWSRSLGGSAFEEGRPWITFEAARLLEATITPASRVFEYGSGGSTVFLAERCAEVVSVEHDPKWFDVVRGAVEGRPGLRFELVQPRPVATKADAAVTSTVPEFAGVTFADYVGVIDGYPDHHFDVLVIDGRARPSCFFRGQPKVRDGGLVILDDSERPAYRDVLAAARSAGWVERGRLGPKPFSIRFSRTTVWTKTRDLDRR